MRPDLPDPADLTGPGREAEDESRAAAAADDESEPEQAESVAQAESDAQRRLWLRAVIPLLQLRSHDTDPSCRVQFAFDQMYISACERVARILRCDLEAGPGEG
ncbi:MAG: hypothetical protein U0790_23750 [Isosphaeraceae bacterium]